MLSKTAIGIAAGAGIAFIGYCVYFDRKRRSDPDFKKKLRERRKKQRQASKTKSGVSQIPDLRDAEAMQKFFLQEVQLGEELLASGDISTGVEHLTNAVAVCGQPNQLLQVLQQTLPAQVFQLLIERLPSVSQRIMASSPLSGAPDSEGVVLADDDLE